MAEPDFTLRRGDSASRLQAVLTDSAGDPVTIEGATVLLKLAPIAGGTLTVAAVATVDQVGSGTATDGLMGSVHYDWLAADTANAGLYLGEWEVTYLGGDVETFPNADPFLVHITAGVS